MTIRSTPRTEPSSRDLRADLWILMLSAAFAGGLWLGGGLLLAQQVSPRPEEPAYTETTHASTARLDLVCCAAPSDPGLDARAAGEPEG